MWNRVACGAVVMMVLGSGCAVDEEDASASVEDAGGAGGVGIGGDCVGCGGSGGHATIAPTFDEVFQTALVATGCVYGCHDETSRGGLTLSPTENGAPEVDVAYAALVGPVSSSRDCGGQPLIVPGAPEQSLMWLKMAAELGVPGVEVCGASMPKGSGQITGADLDLVGQWILAGAARE